VEWLEMDPVPLAYLHAQVQQFGRPGLLEEIHYLRRRNLPELDERPPSPQPCLAALAHSEVTVPQVLRPLAPMGSPRATGFHREVHGGVQAAMAIAG
jgi:hypothetical protein